MELLALIGGLLGLVMFVGSIAGFFGMFSSSEKARKLYLLEQEADKLRNEVTRINTKVDVLQKQLDAQLNQSSTVPVQAANLKVSEPSITVDTASATAAPVLSSDATLPINPAQINAKAPIVDVAPVEPVPVLTITANGKQSRPEKSATARAAIKPTYIPPPPNLIERGFAAAKEWLFGGNTLVRVGMIILFIGLSFFVQLAISAGIIPIELRLTAIALAGIALLVTGWRVRDTRQQYSWTLQGGGIGVLYLTIFASFKLYSLIPSGPAFALLIVIAFLSAFIAVKQSALPLAILGFTGGFLAPILTSTNSGNHVGLFSYYLVLNLAIAYVAYHKTWRPLNVLGWAFTFIVATLWGAKKYIPENFATTEPFLIIFFLLFTAIAVLYAHRQATKASDYVDATLVFGTPLVGFSLQYALLKNTPFGLAYSALALGIFYLGLAWWLLTRKKDSLKFLGECFLALGIGFVTLTLPLALDGRWTSAAWAVEGVGLLWVGLKQHRTFPIFTGLALQILGAIAFVQGWGLSGYTGITYQNMFLGVAFIALSGWACGALLNHYRPNKLQGYLPLALWGWAWWAGAGLTAIDEFIASQPFAHASLIFITATSLLLPLASKQLRWRKLSSLTTLLLPSMVLVMLWDLFIFLFDDKSPLSWFGYLAWPFAFGAYAWLISMNLVPKLNWLRAPLLWVMAVIGILEWQYQLGTYVAESNVWSEIGWGVVPLLIVGAITYWLFANNRFAAHRLEQAQTWAWVGSLPLMAFTVAWYFMMSLNSSGSAAPLPYIPLLNPLDITLAAALLLMLIWQRTISKHLGKLQRINPILVSVMAFTLLNGILLRTLHHWAGTPHLWESLFNNHTVQMAFTFLWSITAFGLMLLAHKLGNRQLWKVGAALIALVVVKLFLLDLSGLIERVASFIGAGLIMLAMGYFVPIPPAKDEASLLNDANALKNIKDAK